jgi:hypothetical protein
MAIEVITGRTWYAVEILCKKTDMNMILFSIILS